MTRHGKRIGDGREAQILRTYFIDSRGDEAMGSTWSYLDITALGRQEEWEDLQRPEHCLLSVKWGLAIVAE